MAPPLAGLSHSPAPAEPLQLRVYGSPDQPALVYLPGLHGDWTLVPSFRHAVEGRVRFVELTYPRTRAWSLEDYAEAIEGALLHHGIERGWLLGESFGSQPAWVMLNRARRPRETQSPGFQPQGLILAGGFVRHPVIPGVRAAAWAMARMPMAALRGWLWVYATYARFRHRQAPETLASLGEFLERRTEADRGAMVHRLQLIAGADLRGIASTTRVPVHYLAGAIDPLVPFPLARAWLWRHCPGYRGGQTLWRADHNVLATAPGTAAHHVLGWMGLMPGPSA